MIKRLKRLWALSNESNQALVDRMFEDIRINQQHVGKGNAVFLPDMTEVEHEDYVHKEERGWKKFYQQFFGVKDDSSL